MADAFRVGDWFVEPQLNSMTANRNAVRVEPKMMQVLVCLAEHAGEVVPKESLIRSVWADTFVTDDVLTRSISELRRVFGDDPKDSRFIQTIPKSGYRLIAPVVFDRAKQEAVAASLTGGDVTPAVNPRSRWLNARVLAGCLILVGITAVAFYLWAIKKPGASGNSTPIRSIAVLPFKPLVTASHDEVLEMGIADALISRLSSIREITVQPLAAVRKYTNPEQDAVTIGATLGVEGVLDSSIQIVEGKIRVRSQLVRVSDGRQLWRFECDDKCADILAVEDSISQRIASALALTLTAEESVRLTRRYTSDTDTYNLYLKGRFFWNRLLEDDVEKAIAYFHQVIAREPNYAPAYSGLADCYIVLVTMNGRPSREYMPKARDAASNAIEIDDTLGEAHASLGQTKLLYEWDLRGAEKEFKRSIDLSPNYAMGRMWHAFYLTALGRHDDAISEGTRAVALEPTSLILNKNLGFLLYEARRYDEALEQWRKTQELRDPEWPRPAFVADSYVQKGMYREAVTEVLDNVRLAGNSKQNIEALRNAFERDGIRGEFRKIIELYPNDENNADNYAFLGENEKAIAELEKKYDERAGLLIFLQCNPYYDSLRSDPRFADLVRRIGLPQ